MQSGVNIVDCGLIADGSSWTQRVRYGAFKFNKSANNKSQNLTFFNFSSQDDLIGWHTHWTRTATPVWYVQATKPIDGTDLTFRHHQINNNSTPVSGYVVSAASPDGPWVVRGAWDSSTPSPIHAGTHTVTSTTLQSTTVQWEGLHFQENQTGTTTLWQVCEKLQAEVNALKTHNARLTLLEHFVHDAWRQHWAGNGMKDRLTEWTDFQY